MFDTLIVFLKDFFQKDDFEKINIQGKMRAKFPSRQRVKKFKIYKESFPGPLTLFMLGNFSCFSSRLLNFFQN